MDLPLNDFIYPVQKLFELKVSLTKSHILDEVNLLLNRYGITGLTINPKSHLHEALPTADSFLEHNKDIDYTIIGTRSREFYRITKILSIDFL
jgi:hypothetical protein